MLPKLNAPTFELKLLSQDKPVRYRPFTVKEEKILLIAEESKVEKEIIYAIKQIIQNCCVSDLDADNLPLFDLMHFYIQLRAKSVNNISKVSYRDKEDNEVYEFNIDFDQVVPKADSNHTKEITLEKDFVVTFNYPTYEMLKKLDIDKDTIDTTINMIALCMDKIIQGDEVYVCADTTQEQRIDFIESLTTQQFEQITDNFVMSMPKINYKIEYINLKGNKREIILSEIGDFFQ